MEHVTTLGMEFGVYFLSTPCGKRIKIQVWDTSGQERFRSITRSYYRKSSVVMVLYDISCRDTFQSITYWIAEVRRYVHPLTLIVVVGNKYDLHSKRQVSTTDGAELARIHGALFFESSSLLETDLDELFQECVKTRLSNLPEASDDLVALGISVPITCPTNTTFACC